LPRIACASRAVAHPRFGGARVRTPHVAILGKGDAGTYREECFGPVAYLVEVEDEREGLEEMRMCLEQCGALSACVYADDADLVEETLDLAAHAGVNAAANLSGESLVNHSMAFSDYHGTGANAACSACLTDAAFVAPRFYVAESRRPAPA